MFCNTCGAKLNEGQKFCTSCGAEVKPRLVEAMKPSASMPTNAAPWMTRRLKIIICVVVILLIALSILASVVLASLNTARQKGIQNGLANSWQTYDSVSEQFSVLFPKTPTIDASHDLTQNNTDATFGYIEYDSKPAAQTTYLLFKYRYVNEIDTTNADSILENMLSGMVSSDTSNSLESSNHIIYQGYPALDHVIKNGDEYIKGRLILVGQNPYWLALDCMSAYCSDSEYQKFINSFEIK